jgi:hypothetical protein
MAENPHMLYAVRILSWSRPIIRTRIYGRMDRILLTRIILTPIVEPTMHRMYRGLIKLMRILINWVQRRLSEWLNLKQIYFFFVHSNYVLFTLQYSLTS